MKEFQTPRKGSSLRRLKDSPTPISDYQSKKLLNTAKKSLDRVFTSVSEELLTESVTESFNFLELENLNDDHHKGDSIENFECLLAADNYSLADVEASTMSDSASSSKITSVNDESIDQWIDRRRELESKGCNDIREIVMVEGLLKQAKVQVSRSSEIHPGLKKLLEALIEVFVKEFGGLPVVSNQSKKEMSKGYRVLVFCFLVFVMICMSVVVVFSGGSDTRSSFSFYPKPT